MADWFTARGFRAFVLSYRLTSNGYLLPVPLLDARRAMQTGAGEGAGLPDRSESDCDHRFLGGRTPGGAGRTQFVPGNPEAEDPSSASPAARTTWCWAIRGSGQSRATLRT